MPWFPFAAHAVAGLLIAATLAGCSAAGWDSYNQVSLAIPPRASAAAAPIRAALACIRAAGALRNTRIGVAIHADGTGKYNHIADGATGNFLPQGTTAVYVSEAVLLAGGQAFNYYELNTERAMRLFLTTEAQRTLADEQFATLPDYVLSTSFTALDFIGGPTVDIRVAGVGPTFQGRGASVEAVAELYRPGSRTILQVSSIQRYVAFRAVGFGIAKLLGGGSGALVTGGADFADQQRLQEATRDVVALSVADVLVRFPNVPEDCRQQVAALEGGSFERATADPAFWAEPPAADKPPESAPATPKPLEGKPAGELPSAPVRPSAEIAPAPAQPQSEEVRVAAVAVAPASPVVSSTVPKSLSVVVVGTESSDPRWNTVEEAVEFWNQHLEKSGTGIRLGPIIRLVRPVPDAALRRMSEATVAGLHPGIPKELADIPCDIIVALSNRDISSFALPWHPDRQGMVGLRRADIPPLSLPNVLRNVTAHNLGHVLGLRHNGDPATLMCGRPAPCLARTFASPVKHFFPLAEVDTTSLHGALR